jgi:hypothetical protein
MSVEELMPFLHNIAKEARKGYYEEDQNWIDGYVTAIDDILWRIESDEGDDDATQ